MLTRRPLLPIGRHFRLVSILAALCALSAFGLAETAGAGAHSPAPHISRARAVAGPSRPKLVVRWLVQHRAPTIDGVTRGKLCRLRVSGAGHLKDVRVSVVGRKGAATLSPHYRKQLADDRLTGGLVTCSLNTKALPNGPITVRATATDTKGENDSAVHRFQVENTIPYQPAPPTTTPPSGSSTGASGPSSWFSPTSVWNRQLGSQVPLASNSTGYVSELVRQVNSAGPWINTDEYSTPVYTVGAEQPTVKVKLVAVNGGWAEPGMEAAFAEVPLPANARPAAGTDEHLVVWQPSTNKMWEFWCLHKEGSSWVAAFGGAMQNVGSDPGYYEANAWAGAKTYWGATATSLPLVGGLMTIKELQAGQINHALALAIPEPSSKYVWPAQRSDGGAGPPNAIPEGTIFRLPASLDLSSLHLSPTVLAIATAAQKYGMVVRDRSGCVSLYGEDPTPSGGNPYSQIFEGQYPNSLMKQFPWASLQAIAPGN
jgi:hypothetical protein